MMYTIISPRDKGLITRKGERRNMEGMTDRQYDGILQMIEMIVEGCEDLDEAKKKIAALRQKKQDKPEKEKTE